MAGGKNNELQSYCDVVIEWNEHRKRLNGMIKGDAYQVLKKQMTEVRYLLLMVEGLTSDGARAKFMGEIQDIFNKINDGL